MRNVEYEWKEERSRMMSELTTLRQRVHDFETERARTIQLSKFLDKHTPNHHPHHSNQAHPPVSESKITQAIKQAQHDSRINNITKAKIYALDEIMRTQEKQGHDPSHMIQGVVRSSHDVVPGSYLREEETKALSAEVELTLSALHDSLVSSRPTLLPLLRKLTQEIHEERKVSLEQKANLLDKIKFGQSSKGNEATTAAILSSTRKQRSPSPPKRFKH